MKKLLVAVSMLGLSAIASRPAEAQVRFGAQVDWAADFDLGIGARLGFPLGDQLKRKGIEGLATFDFFFPGNNVDAWQITANGLYHFTQGESAKPYVGAGLLYTHSSVSVLGVGASASDFGINLLGGLRFKAQERLLPFVEAKLQLGDGSQFMLAGGVYFGKP